VETTAVSITAALLCELTKKKVKIVFCDEKRNPSSELIPYYGAHDTSMKVRFQVAWEEDIKKAVWTEIVSEKIRKQAEVLENLGKSEFQLLQEYVAEIEFADESNREGHAAKVYFNAIFGMDFTRTAENSINAALNYGYGLLLSSFNREIAVNGYITQLGLFHDNMYNQFNFGSDLMEPFRPLVDKMVLQLAPQKFEHEEKVYMLTLLQKEVQIAERNEYVTNAIKIYTRSIFDALNEKDVSLIKFYQDEL
jgi:CRISPR-associated endonuclease Cas1 subtype II